MATRSYLPIPLPVISPSALNAVWRGGAWSGSARLGGAGRGAAGLGVAWRGKARETGA